MWLLQFIIEEEWMFKNVFKYLARIKDYVRMDTAICTKDLRQKYLTRMQHRLTNWDTWPLDLLSVKELPKFIWMRLRFRAEKYQKKLSVVIEYLLMIKENPGSAKCFTCNRIFPKKMELINHHNNGCEPLKGGDEFSTLKLRRIDGKTTCKHLSILDEERDPHIPYEWIVANRRHYTSILEEKRLYEMKKDAEKREKEWKQLIEMRENEIRQNAQNAQNALKRLRYNS